MAAMRGNVFVVHGDIARCQADAVIYSTSAELDATGELYSSLTQWDGFERWYAERRAEPRRPVGETDWLAPTATRPGLVLVRAVGGHDTRAPGPRAAAVLERSLARAVDELRAGGRAGPLLLLVPAVLIGQGGGHRERLEVARRSIAAAAAFVADHPDVDVAFVLFSPTVAALFRDARRQLGLAALPDELGGASRLRAAIAGGECVVFVRSGVSAAAGMPRWDALIRRLAERAGLPCTPELPYDEKLAIAQAYRQRAAEGAAPAVADVVCELFGPTPPPVLTHYLLAQLGCRYLFTTNYDRLLEETLARIRRPWGRVTHARDVPETSRAGLVHVIKLHGDAAPQGEDARDPYRDVVLGADDYDRFSEDRAAFELLLSGLMLNHTFLFVGYSLSDENVRRAWARILGYIDGRSREAGYARRAFGLAYDGTEQAVDGLDWVPNTGTDPASRRRCQWRILDALADSIAAPAQLLAPETAPPEALRPIATPLAATAKALATALSTRAPLPVATTTALGRVATLLYELGWRHDAGAPSLWERLADAARDRPAEARDLLDQAIAHAGSRDEVVRLHDRLAELDAHRR